MAAQEHPIRNGVLITLVSAALLYLATLIPGLAAWVGNAIVNSVKYMQAEVSLPRWLVLSLILATLPFWNWLLRKTRSRRGPNPADYREDHFHGVVWRWSYGLDNTPINPWCFCPRDDTVLVWNYSPYRTGIDIRCETCAQTYGQFDGDMDYVQEMIVRQIDRRIRSGEWKQVVAHRVRS